MPLAYPLKHIYYFCDESSFFDEKEKWMGVAGIAIRQGGLPILRNELAEIRKRNRARGEIKWNNISRTEKQARIDFIDHFWTLSNAGRFDFHIRFAPFDEYAHDDFKRRRFDTTSRMVYELLLHRAVRHYGKWDRLYIRPDDGECTRILPHLKAGLNADGVRQYETNPQCVDSIECLSSESEPILQFLDVVLGAFTALRNDRALTGPKRDVADHALATLKANRRDLGAIHSDTRRFSIWNVIPKKREPKQLTLKELDPQS